MRLPNLWLRAKATRSAAPVTPAEPAKPAEPMGAIDTRPAPGALLSSSVDDAGVSASSEGVAKKPKIVLELSGTGAGIANQYVEYKGWTLENGPSKGFRLEANLIGIQNVIQACLESNVERMIFTSSDKAVNPTNAMGASKLMGERRYVRDVY